MVTLQSAVNFILCQSIDFLKPIHRNNVFYNKLLHIYSYQYETPLAAIKNPTPRNKKHRHISVCYHQIIFEIYF